MRINQLFPLLKLGFLVVFAIFVANCSSSDEEYNVPTSGVGVPVLERYLNSKEGADALRAHGVQLAMVDKQGITTDTFAMKDVVAYEVPFVENGKATVLMTVFVKHGGAVVHSLFADQRDVTTSGGEVIITDEHGDFISQLSLSSDTKEHGKMNVRISRVKEDPKVHINNARLRRETYTHCVSRVYSTAKRACENSNRCRMLCDFSDAFGRGSCTGSMMLAAGVSCI